LKDLNLSWCKDLDITNWWSVIKDVQVPCEAIGTILPSVDLHLFVARMRDVRNALAHRCREIYLKQLLRMVMDAKHIVCALRGEELNKLCDLSSAIRRTIVGAEPGPCGNLSWRDMKLLAGKLKLDEREVMRDKFTNQSS
jgi:hypothetical protein